MKFDFIFIGAGLANLLAAYRLRSIHPGLRVLVLEREVIVGGRHTWSFHENDLKRESLEWVQPFVTREWMGYDVRFPQMVRTLNSRYLSIDSAQLALQVRQAGVEILCGAEVLSVGASHVTTPTTRYEAECVFDGRGWNSPEIPCAYQKFLGQRVRLLQSHSLSRPVIMDARVPQKDGYRFIYLLPWSETELLVEDTRYSDSPSMDLPTYRFEIENYCRAQGYEIASRMYEEVGVLAIPLKGNLNLAEGGAIAWGTRAGFFHATTGYSFPLAVKNAERLSELGTFHGPTVAANVREWAKAHWEQGKFLRGLNRMLFLAAAPAERYEILQRFYGLPDGVIERFYSHELTLSDRARILSGRPPISLGKAMKALLASVEECAKFQGMSHAT